MSRDQTGWTHRSIFCKVTFSDTEGGQINIISSVLSTTFQEEGEKIEVGSNKLDWKALAMWTGQVYKWNQPPFSLPTLKEPGSLPYCNLGVPTKCISVHFEWPAVSFSYICFTLYHCFFFHSTKSWEAKTWQIQYFPLKIIQGVADASGEPSVILAVNIHAVWLITL